MSISCDKIWYQDICPFDLDHLWNLPLSGAFVFHKHIFFVGFFMPPLKKGAYCFATVGRRSVGLSVCRSVDHCVAAQYLLTPPLDQYHTLVQGLPSMSI